MNGLERAIRRAINPLSTRVTMLVQGAPGHPRAASPPAPRVVSAAAVVPDVVGLSSDDALLRLAQACLVAANGDPDGPPVAMLDDGVVVAQRPAAGRRLPRDSRVRLWVQRGPGSAGVREPRRPAPDPRSMRAMRDEETGDAV
jgi:hypothetical protein